ncbi:MAG: TetR/AcrR family transcriptional regulator [Sphingobium sp.]
MSGSAVLKRQENYRVRVARERRERMRAHLLNSVMIVCSGEDSGSPAVIEDVIRHADVSRGTFYKYFDSLDQAMCELAQDMADDMAGGGIVHVYDGIEDPLIRTAAGFLLYLTRARIEPEWGGFVCRVGLLNASGVLAGKIVTDIEAGIASGDYVIPSLPVALDLVIGTKIEAIQRIISGGVGPDYLCGMTSMILRALGVAPVKADHVVAGAYQWICTQAPDHLHWWKEMGAETPPAQAEGKTGRDAA